MELHDLAGDVLKTMRQRRLTLCTAESCTGGLVSAAITEHPGSSDVFVGGWVTYANSMKVAQLGVPGALLEASGPGAVSRESAEAMAVGARGRSGADWAVAITGIAGPGGGSAAKPVGTVWIACAREAVAVSRSFHFPGDRQAVRAMAATEALEMLLRSIDSF